MPADALIRPMEARPAQCGATPDLPAIFGKMPGHGDFISRGLRADLRAGMDIWLSDWLAAAQVASGAAFDDDYENAAPWLFEGPRAIAVLLPSRDAVGRRFPLLVLASPDRVTQQIYDAMIAALVDGASADDLHGVIAALEPTAPRGERCAQWFLPDGAAPVLPAPDDVGSWPSVEGCFV